jgi:hypothetical protein
MLSKSQWSPKVASSGVGTARGYLAPGVTQTTAGKHT